MKIKVEEALVKTATVEIKTLSIGGKQVTLAVFRQLQEESVVDYELLQLNGPIWGRINYHPDKNCGDEDHVHLVWQSGTELRRSYVGKKSFYPTVHERISVRTHGRTRSDTGPLKDCIVLC